MVSTPPTKPTPPTTSPATNPIQAPIVSDQTLALLKGDNDKALGLAVDQAAGVGPDAKNGKPAAAPKPGDKKAAQAQEPDNGDRYKVHFRVRIGKMEFSNTKGDFLGQPYIRLSTYQHSSLKCVINDPDDQLRIAIAKQSDVEVELGFVNGKKQNVFVGKLYSVGRRPPDGTEIVAVDPSFQLQQQQGSGVQFASEQPSQNPQIEAQQKPVVADQTVALLSGQNDKAMGLAIEQAYQQDQARQKSNATDAKAKANTKATSDAGKGAGEKPATGKPSQTSPDSKATTQIPGMTSGFSLDLIRQEVSNAATQGKPTITPAEQFATAKGLKFADKRDLANGKIGGVQVQQTQMQVAAKDAALQGDVLVTSGNTVKQVAPGQGEPSGVVLDYLNNRSVFIGKPVVFKRMGLQLQSGFGALSVVGASVNDKQTVGATVVTPGPAPEHPTGVIQVPDWKAIKLSDPIFPGSSFTWADATKNGSRVPTKAVMGAIVKIAQAVQPLMDKTVGKGKKWEVTSWYRDPASNAAAGGASGSRHMTGDAIDFYFTVAGGEQALHKSLYDSWNGGLAIKPGSFCHIDTGSKRRWNY